MKRMFVILLALSLLLFSCADPSTDSEETTDAPPINSVISPSVQIALDAAEEKANYYQALVSQLQQEIIAMKTELYETRADYEARIEELQSELDLLSPASADFTYVLEGEGAIITAYVGESEAVVIPEEIEGYPVCKIADKAFENNTKITSVVLPTGVREIGWFAFAECVSLQSIQIPDAVVTIRYGAFENHHSNLTFVCAKDSYAAQYAKSYGIIVTQP